MNWSNESGIRLHPGIFARLSAWTGGAMPIALYKFWRKSGLILLSYKKADKRLGQRHGVLPLDRLKNDHGYDLAPFAENTVSHGWHGNAVLYGPRISLKNAKRLPIPSLEPRGCVSAHLETDSGHSLEVIGVHLGLTSKAREQQIGYIRHYGENMSAQTPLLVGGDFNEWRQAKKNPCQVWAGL